MNMGGSPGQGSVRAFWGQDPRFLGPAHHHQAVQDYPARARIRGISLPLQ